MTGKFTMDAQPQRIAAKAAKTTLAPEVKNSIVTPYPQGAYCAAFFIFAK